MTTCYKLTNQNNTTYNNCLWGEDVTHETNGIGGLCGPGWLHAYQHPLIAVFLNPIHADINNPKLWECIGDGKYRYDNGLKCGFTKLTTIRELPLPEVTTEQRVAFGILCAKEVCKDTEWTVWADNWLSGTDRTSETAWAAADVADLVARTAQAASTAAWAAYWAADYAVGAADAVVWAAVDAARAAALAADRADYKATDIDLVSLAQKAMKY